MKILLASISLLFSFSVSAFGSSAAIGSPELGHRAGLDETQKKQVSALLDYMDNDLEFIDGSFINEFSTQRFGGTSAKASRLIDLLTKAGLWEVQVGFRDFGEQKSALMFHQNSPDSVHVTINSGRDDFLLKDFQKYLSQIVLSKTSKPTAEQNGADQPATAPESKAKAKGKEKP